MNRVEEIRERLSLVRSQVPDNVTLIVVTKTFPVSDLQILYTLGERNFGENRDSEGSEKSREMPDDAIWHFQGGLQSNKIKSIVHWADYIHSLDDLTHATRISRCANEIGKRERVFIQVSLDSQLSDNRSGVAENDFLEFAHAVLDLPGIEVVGVMGIGEVGANPEIGFERLAAASAELRRLSPGSNAISAGMSGDFPIAIAYGATHIRVGSSILGSRPNPL